VPTQCPAVGDILIVDTSRFGIHRHHQLVGRLTGAHRPGENVLHPLNRPEQIDGGRPRRRQQVARPVKLRG